MPIDFFCRSCHAPLRTPKDKAGQYVTCGACRGRVYVPDPSFAKAARELVSAGQGISSFAASFYKDYIRLEWPLPDPELRSCRSCGRITFREPLLCSCQAPTSGTGFAEFVTGDSREAQLAYQQLMIWKGRGRLVQIAAVGLVALSLVFIFFRHNLLYFTLYFLPTLLISGLIALLMVLLTKTFIGLAIAPKLPGTSRHHSARLAELEQINEELIEPFFDRNGISSRRELPAPPEDRKLLAQLLQSKGHDSFATKLDELLVIAALRRDYRRFAATLDALAEHHQDDRPSTSFHLYRQALGNTAEPLPFFQQYLAERGLDTDPESIRADLKEVAGRLNLELFEKDLASRRGQTTRRRISIDEIDRIDPYNFEALLAMIYESLGYQVEETPASGDQGADVLLSLGPEKTVIQAKLYSQPVGNKAVQEVSAALRHYGAHKAKVVTNNQFTAAAKELAQSNNVELIDREQLTALIERFNDSPKNYARLDILMQARDSLEPDDDYVAEELEVPDDA